MIAFKSRWKGAVECADGSDQASDQDLDFDSDEDLEAALRRELIEIARLYGLSEPEAMWDILLDNSPRSTSQ
jgi:hypothetical protein